jgi:FkbM family methyltransferase
MILSPNTLTRCKQWLKRLAQSGGFYVSRTPMVNLEGFALDIQNRLLETSGAVLHIGAHRGQEAEYYNKIGLNVIWIEASPAMFEILKTSIAKYKNQRAVCALLGDVEGKLVDFHIANNDGASSSMFQFGEELGIDGLRMSGSEKLRMERLDNLFETKEVSSYSHWVLDVQGAELLVLKGAGSLLDSCNSLYVEVSTREVYEDGASWNELSQFLRVRGLIPLWDPKAKSHENIVFIRYGLNVNSKITGG